ncbi:MAG: hypothetical protein IPJ62_07995 [Betaproteobacteria bacterium]|nr:hypothetical protein [Betaproteobacteria bacterium]
MDPRSAIASTARLPDGVASEFPAAVAAPVDRGRVERWLGALDPTLDPAAMAAIWQHAGADDSARAAGLYATLSRLLGPAAATLGADRAALLDGFVADPAHRARVVALAGQDSDALAALARGDLGARVALQHGDAFALTGNRGVFATYNAGGDADRFDPDSGQRLLADSWLDDRAKFVAWMHAGADERAAAVPATTQWTFVDRGRVGADGGPVTLVLGGGDGDGDGDGGAASARHQVVFGTAADEVVTGAGGTDRLHGERGDDVLRGGQGDDLLDGGQGGDLLLGGAGTDDLDGGAGDDELDGGAGSDRLDGGSGDDLLAGGRGRDLLQGGAGLDTYAFDAGDGEDVVVDRDGDGRLLWDGEALGGVARQSADGTWTLADGQVTLTLAGDDLLLQNTADREAGRTADGDLLRIRGWHDGSFGITLAAAPESAAPLPEGEAAVESADPAVAPGAVLPGERWWAAVAPPPPPLPDLAGIQRALKGFGSGGPLPALAVDPSAGARTDVACAGSGGDAAVPLVPATADVAIALAGAGEAGADCDALPAAAGSLAFAGWPSGDAPLPPSFGSAGQGADVSPWGRIAPPPLRR